MGPNRDEDEVPRNANGSIAFPEGHDFTADNAINRAFDDDVLKSNMRRNDSPDRSQEDKDAPDPKPENTPDPDRGPLDRKDTNAQEQRAADNTFGYPTNSNENRVAQNKPRGSLRSRIKQNRAVLTGGIGISSLAVAIFLALVPLKLESTITNLLQNAAEIPSYAMQQRIEYLVTRAVATRALMAMNHSTDDMAGKMIFCKNAAVGCSVFSTVTMEYINKEMNLDFDSAIASDGKRVLVVKPSGREFLGGNARSWTIGFDVERSDGSKVEKIYREFTTNAEMKGWIKERVAKKGLKYNNAVNRFLVRKLLMKKYGVVHFRAFEKTSNKIADIRSELRSGIYKNTIGRISPRFASYMACFEGGTDTCDKVIEKLNTAIGDPGPEPAKGSADYEKKHAEWERKSKQLESIKSVQARIAGEIPAEPVDGIEKFIRTMFSKTVMKVAGAAGVVATVDFVLTAVNAINDGAIEQIGADIVSQVAIGYTYGTSAGVIPNWEKCKAGDCTDETGAEVLNVLGGQLDCNKSPLCAIQVQGERINSTVDQRFKRECYEDGQLKEVVLPKNELVCKQYTVYRDYTSMIRNNPGWQGLAVTADAWVHSPAHTIVGFFNSLVGAVFETVFSFPGIRDVFQAVTKFVGDNLAGFMAGVMNLIFDPPNFGDSVDGASNADGVAIATAVTQNEVVMNGYASDGSLAGSGGRYLSPQELSEIVTDSSATEKQLYAELPVLERLFSPSIRGSLTQQLAYHTPSNPLEFTTTILAMARQSLGSSAYAEDQGALPTRAQLSRILYGAVHVPPHGYPTNDPAITQDVSELTPEYCQAQRTAREASRKLINGMVVYMATDRCALTEVASRAFSSTEDPAGKDGFISPFVGEGLSSSSTASTPSGVCPAGTKDYGNRKGYSNGVASDIVTCGIVDWPANFPNSAGDTIVEVNSAIASDTVRLAQAMKAQTTASNPIFKSYTASVGFRTYEQQQCIYDYYKTGIRGCSMFVTKPSDASPAGYSNHQMGYSIDVADSQGTSLGNWLDAHMKEYGFSRDVYDRKQSDYGHMTNKPAGAAP